MTTIAPTPPGPARPAASSASSTVTQTAAVERPKERTERQRTPDHRDKDEPGHQPKEDLSDELLLKVVRAFGGENGALVDKKV